MLSVREIEKSLILLSNNTGESIDTENEELRKSLDLVTLASTIYYESDYSVFYSMLDKLKQPITLYPNTIGSFLFGNIRDTYGEVESYCSPICHKSLPKLEDKTLIKTKSCSSQIWLLSKKGLKGITSNSKTALIYMKGMGFFGLTTEEINTLKDSGVEQAAILTGDDNNHTYKHTMQDLSSIPIRTNKILESVKNKVNIWFYISLFLIFFIIVLLVAIKWMRI